MSATLNVRLDAIELDREIQCRASIDPTVVHEYAEAMTDGATFPPVALFVADGKHYIGDGWHRVMASKQIGALDIAATVESGGRAAALKHALAANAAHGHRRTNADKRRAVEIALREFPKVSTAVIASMCGVSRPFVDSMKPQDATVASSTVTGADGKQYPAKRKAPPKVEKQKPRTNRGPRDFGAEHMTTPSDLAARRIISEFRKLNACETTAPLDYLAWFDAERERFARECNSAEKPKEIAAPADVITITFARDAKATEIAELIYRAMAGATSASPLTVNVELNKLLHDGNPPIFIPLGPTPKAPRKSARKPRQNGAGDAQPAASEG